MTKSCKRVEVRVNMCVSLCAPVLVCACVCVCMCVCSCVSIEGLQHPWRCGATVSCLPLSTSLHPLFTLSALSLSISSPFSLLSVKMITGVCVPLLLNHQLSLSLSFLSLYVCGLSVPVPILITFY